MVVPGCSRKGQRNTIEKSMSNIRNIAAGARELSNPPTNMTMLDVVIYLFYWQSPFQKTSNVCSGVILLVKVK